jgi:radical SAM protein with 4Fe4S-binding SPASM domain
MALNQQNPLFREFLDRDEVSRLVDDLVWIHDNLGIYVDVLESLPKCVFSGAAIQSGLPFLRRRCQAGRKVISVSPFGEVRPCAHNPVSYGNLMLDPFDLIWSRMADWRGEKYIPTKCKGCPMLPRCFGGCRINANVAVGAMDADDPWSGDPIELFGTHSYPRISFSGIEVIRRPDKFRWREEPDGHFTICTSSPNNAITVSSELFRFLSQMMADLPLSFDQIVERYGFQDKREKIKSVLESLVAKEILLSNISEGRDGSVI